MLEEFAEQQRHIQALQTQRNALQMQLEAEACPAEPAVEAVQLGVPVSLLWPEIPIRPGLLSGCVSGCSLLPD